MNTNKGVLTAILIGVIVALGAAGVFAGFIGRDADTDSQTDPNANSRDIVINRVDEELEEDGVMVQLENTGENTWNYVVKTELPNPCYVMDVDVVIAESFPEQVSFNVVIADTSEPDTMCIQVIQPAEESGTLQVNEDASFGLSVGRE